MYNKWSNHQPLKKTQNTIKYCCRLLCSRTILVWCAHLQQDQMGTVLHMKWPRSRNIKQEIRLVQIQTFCIVVASFFCYTRSCAFLFHGAAHASTFYGYTFLEVQTCSRHTSKSRNSLIFHNSLMCGTLITVTHKVRSKNKQQNWSKNETRLQSFSIFPAHLLDFWLGNGIYLM